MTVPTRSARRWLGALALLLAALAGCSPSEAPAIDADAGSGADERPTVAVVFNVLADVAAETFGDQVELIDVMPRGVDPHSFQISPAEAGPIYDADLVIANGLNHEEGLARVIRNAEAEGVPLLEIAPLVDPLPYRADVVEDEDVERGALDPHFFTDPVRMAEAPHLMVDALLEVAPDLDETALRERADAYVARLEQLHLEIEEILATVPEDRRYLVTNHSVFNYFAQRYGFTEVGAVLPSGTTLASPSPADLEDLAATIEEYDVPAIFADIGAPDRLAQALADEVDVEVEIVALYTETLGEDGSGAETYIDMQRTNAQEIARALS
jgi:zinc/manganese transport system substrate-binding protein